MKFCVLLFIAATITACSSFDVTTDYNPATDFTAFRTFAIKREAKIPGDVLQQNNFTRDRVFIGLENALLARGFQSVDEREADILVLTYAGIKERMNMNTYTTAMGPGWGGGWGGMGMGPGWGGGGAFATQTVVTHFNEGTLYIDILDAKEKALVWKGQGTGVIERSRSPKEREEMVNEAIGEILAKFPPR
ncbi:MAG: DUF4136 domain-containing protein [Ignavibacteriae bacterium]|nr:MAG: DUF4136 domain-containing protein [Ignavibacteriota bacterium]